MPLKLDNWTIRSTVSMDLIECRPGRLKTKPVINLFAGEKRGTISLIISIAALIMRFLTRNEVREIDETLNESYGRTNVIEGDILDIKTALDKISFNRLKAARGNVFNKDLKSVKV